MIVQHIVWNIFIHLDSSLDNYFIYLYFLRDIQLKEGLFSTVCSVALDAVRVTLV